MDAEKFAVFAGLLAGADYPQAALAKAWVQLAYGAHHDAITGSESDQVYLDLLTGWRDAWEPGRAARDNSLALLSSASTVKWSSGIRWRTTGPMWLRSGLRIRWAPGYACSTTMAPSCPRLSSTTDGRSAGWRATCRRWVGGPTGWSPVIPDSMETGA